MNNKYIGSILCLISALLMCTRYLSAIIFMSNGTTWSEDLFGAALEYVGTPLKIASIIELIIGIIFIIYMGCIKI